MRYTIAFTKDAAGTIVSYEKAGRSYLVEIYNINTTASSYKVFHTQEGAIKAYTTVVTWLLQSMYSDEQRRKMLLEMHD